MCADELEIMSEDEFYQNDKKEDSDLENNGLSNKKDDSDYENNDSGLENKEDKPKRKKSKKDEDANVDGESDNPGETPEEREEFKKNQKLFMEALKPKVSRKKTEYEKEERKAEIEEKIKQLMFSMAEANEKDQKDFQDHKPPFNRSRYIKTLSKAICDKKLTKTLINDYGIQFLELLSSWITPFRADPTVYPNVGLRLEVYKIIDKLPVNKDFLQRLVENRNTSSTLDIVQVLRATPTKRGSEEQLIIEKILERWLRLIVTNPQVEASNEVITEDGLDALRETANYTQEYDAREDKLEELVNVMRKAAGVQPQQEPIVPKRFVIAPKSGRGQRKKRH